MHASGTIFKLTVVALVNQLLVQVTSLPSV